MSAHDFDHLNPAVRTSRGSRTLDHLCHVSQRRVKPECVIRSCQIFIDCLGNTDYRNALLRQTRGNAEGILAAARDDGVKTELLDVGDHFGRLVDSLPQHVGCLKWVCARRAEVSAAISIPAPYACAVKRYDIERRIEQTEPTIAED